MYVSEMDWWNAVADEIERETGTRVSVEDLIGDDGYPGDLVPDADEVEASRLGLSLVDFLNFKADVYVLSVRDPYPSPDQLADDARRPDALRPLPIAA